MKIEIAQDGSCHFPLTQGPCNEDQLVVATEEEGEGRCEEACPADQLLFFNATVEGECVNYDTVECSHRGERAYATLDGTFECDCAEGWGREGGEGECKQEGTMCGENRSKFHLSFFENPSKFSPLVFVVVILSDKALILFLQNFASSGATLLVWRPMRPL